MLLSSVAVLLLPNACVHDAPSVQQRVSGGVLPLDPRVLPFTLKTFTLKMAQSNVGKICETEYARSWSFRAIPAMPTIPPGNRPSVDTVKNLLRNQTLPARPERVTHIEARYKLDASSSTELSLEGDLQHSSGINRYQPKRWFDAAWTPVGGRLSINPDYKKIWASICGLEYSHVQVFGTPKLGTGGTGDRNRTSATVRAHLVPHS